MPLAFAFANAIGSFGSEPDTTFVPTDIAGCVLWLRADLGITYVQGPVVATGTTPPTVTLSGTPSSSTNTIDIDITTLGVLGVALFSWKLNGVTQQTLQVTSASFPLAGTGLTAVFGSGTYAANNVYTSAVTVSAWADQSGQGNIFNQGTATYQFQFSAVGINSLPSVLGNNTSTFMESNAGFTVAQPYTIYAVAQATTQNTKILISGTSIAWFFGAVSPTQVGAYYGATLYENYTATVPTIYTALFNNTSSTTRASPGNAHNAGAIGSSAASGRVTIGSYQTGASWWWDKWISEYVIYSRALSTSEDASVLAYLGTRYAISTP